MIIIACLTASLAAAADQSGSDTSTVKVEITRIDVEDTIYTPYYDARTVLDHQQGTSKKWLQLHVEYTTEGGWIDELTIIQSALVRESDEQPLIILDEEVTYLNVGPGDHYANVYMHPNLVERYDVGSYDVDTAAVFKIKGQTVARAETTKQAEEGWSTREKAAFIEHKGHLLNHAQTPFWFINYDFKELIKPGE